MGGALGGCRRCDCYQLGRLDALAELGGARHNRPDNGTDEPSCCCTYPSAACVRRATEAYRAGRTTERQLQAVPLNGTECGPGVTVLSVDLDRMPVQRWHE